METIPAGSPCRWHRSKSARLPTSKYQRPACQGGIAAPQAVPTVREIIFNGRRFIAGRHVAAILGCNPRTLLRWHRENEDPQKTKIAGRVFYDFD